MDPAVVTATQEVFFETTQTRVVLPTRVGVNTHYETCAFCCGRLSRGSFRNQSSPRNFFRSPRFVICTTLLVPSQLHQVRDCRKHLRLFCSAAADPTMPENPPPKVSPRASLGRGRKMPSRSKGRRPNSSKSLPVLKRESRPTDCQTRMGILLVHGSVSCVFFLPPHSPFRVPAPLRFRAAVI